MNLIYLMPQLRGFRITNVRLTHDAVALAATCPGYLPHPLVR